MDSILDANDLPAIRQSGNPAIRQSGNPAIRQSGNPAIISQCNPPSSSRGVNAPAGAGNEMPHQTSQQYDVGK
ncbi:hypothetical protein [Burkholderia glumae]|uniref:hypothetical protein n=1 Tax=Burkholderia glumae TaxID=337 RepID=UPI002037415F|nr:hypothetical protein [Burkholderia glumae]MCM2550627.1 hypothetical protein [Burkholderia glumae]